MSIVRKYAALLLTAMVLLGSLLPAGGFALTEAEKDAAFTAALTELENYLENPGVPGRSLDACIAAFGGLGKFNYSDSFKRYATALQMIEEGGFGWELEGNFSAINSEAFAAYIEKMESNVLCSPAQLTAYMEARKAETEGDMKVAAEAYMACIDFYDSADRRFALTREIYASIYEKGLALLDASNLAGAYFMFLECPGYELADTFLGMIETKLGYVPKNAQDNPTPEPTATPKLTPKPTATPTPKPTATPEPALAPDDIADTSYRFILNNEYGAVIDGNGDIWTWDNNSRTAYKTSLSGARAFAPDTSAMAIYDVFYCKTDGSAGEFNFESGKAYDISTDFKVKQLGYGSRYKKSGGDLYLLAENGILYCRETNGTYSPVAGLPAIERFQVLPVVWYTIDDSFGAASSYLVKTVYGDYYGWGSNVFGCYTDSDELMITTPVKLNFDSSKYIDIMFCDNSRPRQALFSCIDKYGTASVFYADGQLLNTLENCKYTSAFNRSFVYKTTQGQYYGCGWFNNGSYLSDCHLFMPSDGRLITFPSETDTLHIGTAQAAALLKDGRVIIASYTDPEPFYLLDGTGNTLHLPM